MLVVSRRCDEEIVFPTIGVTVKILQASANRARLGIDAPAHVQILRGELYSPGEAPPSSHKLRNDLNAITLFIEMYERLVQRGDLDRAHQTYLQMLTRLKEIDRNHAPVQTPAIQPAHPMARVLIVEDDDNERELLAGLLRMDGCVVDTVPDGAEAFARLSSSEPRPDVVLLDMMLPKIDGPNTLSMIRKHERLNDLTVFGMSGRRAEEVGITIGGRDGINAWFEKPLNPNRLVEAIHQTQSTSTVA
jgi:carbon storage regulator CsrA